MVTPGTADQVKRTVVGPTQDAVKPSTIFGRFPTLDKIL